MANTKKTDYNYSCKYKRINGVIAETKITIKEYDDLNYTAKTKAMDQANKITKFLGAEFISLTLVE